MKISRLTASLLTSTAVFAGVAFAQQSQSVSADSKLHVDYSSNLRQNAGTDAKIIGGLSVGETYTYDQTAKADGYTWYEIGKNQWVASAGASATSGQVKVNYASNKRVGPSTSHKIAGGYYPGQVLTFTDSVKAGGYTWYKVGTNAWVASAGVSETAAATTTAAAPAAATTSTQAATAATPAASAASASSATTSVAATTTAPAAKTTSAASTATTTTPAASTTTSAAKTTTSAATTAAPTVTAASGRVQTSVASNVRSNAGTGYSVTGSLPAGAVRSYSATATANGYTWYKIGANAWVAGAKPYYGTTKSTATTSTTRSYSNSASSSNYSAASSNSYSTASASTSTGSKTARNSAGNSYAWGQCTWYVKSVAPWAGNHWGNGQQWGASAAAEGFTVNHTPSVGSIVVVAGGQNFGGWTAAAGYGHVAYVVGVSGNTITVQQGGMGFKTPGGPNTQRVSGASNFTYIHR